MILASTSLPPTVHDVHDDLPNSSLIHRTVNRPIRRWTKMHSNAVLRDFLRLFYSVSPRRFTMLCRAAAAAATRIKLLSETCFSGFRLWASARERRYIYTSFDTDSTPRGPRLYCELWRLSQIEGSPADVNELASARANWLIASLIRTSAFGDALSVSLGKDACECGVPWG